MFRLRVLLYGNEVRSLPLESGREYTFGRASSCDVQLEDLSGISRNHFRMFEENGQWVAQVTSKFGDLFYSGKRVQTVQLEPDTIFKLSDYDFQFLDHHSQRIEAPAAAFDQEPEDSPVHKSENLPAQLKEPGPLQVPAVQIFSGNEEATRVISTVIGAPFLRVVEPTGEEETLKLEGNKWLAGRDSNCEIQLNDRKASRRQFELVSSPQGFFIRDLGSANGTLLNRNRLDADELKPLRSGDVVSVGSLALHFEVRDPNFDKKLMVIPKEVMSPPQAINQSQYEMINYPVVAGPGGAVRLDEYGGAMNPHLGGGWSQDSVEAEKRKRMRIILVVAVALLPVLYFMTNSLDDSSGANSKAAQQVDPLSKLTPQNQQLVKELYSVGRDLVLQQNLENAASNFKRLHELLPEGYQDSKALEEKIRAAAEQAELQKLHEAELRRQTENRLAIEQNIRQCETLASSTYDVQAMRSCLDTTINLDPNHHAISEMIGRVQARIEARTFQMAERRDYENRVAKGRALYLKAETIDQSGDVIAAIDAYQKHLGSLFPDPNGLKSKSQKRLVALKQGVGGKISKSLAEAEQLYSTKDYKGALIHIMAVKALDPMNEPAAKLNAAVRRELNIKLRELYEEAIISEGLGNLQQAVANWKKIIEMDSTDGDYYKKARNKLRVYGNL